MNNEEIVKDFVYQRTDWFVKKYADKSDQRYPTLKIALNLYLQQEGRVIVETGCLRERGDYGSGQSTFLFCDVVSRYGGHVWSIDVSAKNLKVCGEVTKEFESNRTLICNDSVVGIEGLKNDGKFPGKIDLLYLDSWDYPYVEMCYLYDGRKNFEKALHTLATMTDEEVIEKHGDMFLDCQEHTLKELKAALPYLHDKSIILIDDNDMAGGGKSRIAKEWLLDNKYTCLLDRQQTLWIKR